MKYETAILLGEGGMGEVYRAFDPTLKRDVALKFIRGGDPVMVERLLREARLQALVDHPHICKVYEVGEADGRPYIAMQYVEGPSLNRAAAGMALDEKVRVMEVVAEAVHAAHKVGLIHRDLKPGNIIVEKKEGESGHPYVLDFGLAREAEAPGLTETGVAMGTPPYMAPEQARGDVHQLDRRTDVYALGAVLYELLTGRPPFEGTSSVEILIKVLQEDPVPPRKLNAGVPQDLETVVMKCLEKEPGRRYGSARELALDLVNYREGEPLHARPPSATYRILRKVRKNRTVVAASLAGLAVILALGVLWLKARRDSEERAEMAQRFGQEVERIDGIMRQAHLLPLHDIRPDKEQVRERMKAIETEMGRIGRAAEGSARYALGRGHLALQEFDAARADLERAWDAGYRPPEEAYALGQALGVLYQRGLQDTLRIGIPKLREARRRDVERRLREPALFYLRTAREARGVAPGYVEALIAFYEKRYEKALSMARQAADQAVAPYEARKLQGDILVVTGILERKNGAYESAAARFAEAAEPYSRAMDIGRSDPAVYESECFRWLHVAGLNGERGAPVADAFDRGLAACDRAHRADPQSLPSYNHEAQIHRLRAEGIMSSGGDPRPEVSRMIEVARIAATENPRDAESFKNLGQAYLMQAQYELWHGIDLSGAISEAVENLKTAVTLDRASSSAHVLLGAVYETEAQSEVPRGIDPKPALDRAIRSYRSAIAIEPGFAYEYNNIGNCYWYEAAFAIGGGKDPGAALDDAIESYRQAVEIDPKYFLAHHNVGYALQTKADYAVAAGRDPSGLLELAIASYREAARLNPKYSDAFKDAGVAFASKSEFMLDQGSDPLKAAGEGEEMLGTAASLNAGDFENHLTRARIAIVRARWAIRSGTSPAAHFEAARSALRRSLEINPTAAVTHQTCAEWRLRHAEWLLSRKGSAADDLREGLSEAARALSINPQGAEAMAIRGAIELLQARVAEGSAGRLEAARRSGADLGRALEMNPLLKRRYDGLLAEAHGISGSSTDSKR